MSSLASATIKQNNNVVVCKISMKTITSVTMFLPKSSLKFSSWLPLLLLVLVLIHCHRRHHVKRYHDTITATITLSNVITTCCFYTFFCTIYYLCYSWHYHDGHFHQYYCWHYQCGNHHQYLCWVHDWNIPISKDGIIVGIITMVIIINAKANIIIMIDKGDFIIVKWASS